MNDVSESTERSLIAAVQDGLPFTIRPFASLATRLGIAEHDVLQSLTGLVQRQIIRRFGVVVRHRALGYTANAMVVWDIPDDQVDALGVRLGQRAAVTLCYRRPRRRPDWPYNLFCMIHGRDRTTVLAEVAAIATSLDKPYRHEVLFSRRCFKQRGARYLSSTGDNHGPD